MRTSLNELEQIEAVLLNQDKGLQTISEAKTILDKGWKDKIEWQKVTYQFIRWLGKRKLKQTLDNIHLNLFSSPEHLQFQEKVHRYFKS